MRREGVEWTCSRCGKVEFIPYKPLHTKYPEEDEKWYTLDTNADKHLCPKCSKEYFDILNHFLNTRRLSHEEVIT